MAGASDLRDLDETLAALDGRWWHSLDLGNGRVTKGHKSRDQLAQEYENLGVDVAGQTVLDIGAWDGFFSFEAERRGASEVTALDHFVWSTDPFARQRYQQECEARGEIPLPFDEVPEVWQPARLPGKACFDAAHRALGSQVKQVVGDFMTIDLEPMGQFDVVFFLGVLYHLRDPLGAVQRVASLTRRVAVIETEAVHLPLRSRAAMWEAYPGTELGGDPTNWWAPSASALRTLCLASGFRDVVARVDVAGITPGGSALGRARRRVDRIKPRLGRVARHGLGTSRYRLTLQAFK